MTTSDPEPGAAGESPPIPAAQPVPQPVPQTVPEARRPRRLTRSHSDRMVAGVAGGIADYFDIDPSVVRIGIVLLTLFTSGVGMLLYLGAWLVLPESDATTPSAPASPSDGKPRHWRGRRSGTPVLIWGVLLILVGVLLLLMQADVDLPPVEAVLAGLLVVVGVLLLLESRRGLSSGLLMLAVLLSVGLATLSGADVRYDGAFTQRSVAVNRAEELDNSYGHAFGQLRLDLRGMSFPEGTTEVTLSVAFGKLEVQVPRDIPVRIEGTTLFGASQLRGQEVTGFGVDRTRTDSGYDDASKRLLIHVTTLFGSTEVR